MATPPDGTHPNQAADAAFYIACQPDGRSESRRIGRRRAEQPVCATGYNGDMPADKHRPADEQWKRERAAFFERMQAIAEQANVPEQEAEQLVADAVREVRAARRTRA